MAREGGEGVGAGEGRAGDRGCGGRGGEQRVGADDGVSGVVGGGGRGGATAAGGGGGAGAGPGAGGLVECGQGGALIAARSGEGFAEEGAGRAGLALGAASWTVRAGGGGRSRSWGRDLVCEARQSGRRAVVGRLGEQAGKAGAADGGVLLVFGEVSAETAGAVVAEAAAFEASGGGCGEMLRGGPW